MKITDKKLAEWRSGLHAGNPWECKELVAMLDREREIAKAFKETLMAETIEINSAIDKFIGTDIPNGKISSRVIQALSIMRAEIDALKAERGE
jgi:hypothetical protein